MKLSLASVLTGHGVTGAKKKELPPTWEDLTLTLQKRKSMWHLTERQRFVLKRSVKTKD